MTCDICKQNFGDIHSDQYAHHLMPCDHYICHACRVKERREDNNSPLCPVCHKMIEAETC